MQQEETGCISSPWLFLEDFANQPHYTAVSPFEPPSHRFRNTNAGPMRQSTDRLSW